MALFKNMSITYAGMALFAKAQAGQQIKFTKMQVGSGQIGTQNPAALVALIDPKLDVSIVSINPIPELKSATIVGNITNKDVKEALYICEMGLFAIDPDAGEILYGYVSCGQYGDYYAPISQGPYSWQYEINAAIGNAANVTVELSQLNWDYGIMNSNTTFVYLKGGNQKEINKSIDDLFKDIKSQIKIKSNITIAASGWLDDIASSGYFVYDLADTDITANTIVNVNIRVNDLDKANTIKSANQSFNGKVRLYASSAPTADIIADLCLTKVVG